MNNMADSTRLDVLIKSREDLKKAIELEKRLVWPSRTFREGTQGTAAA
jgi:hypothetical protein